MSACLYVLVKDDFYGKGIMVVFIVAYIVCLYVRMYVRMYTMYTLIFMGLCICGLCGLETIHRSLCL